MLRRAPAAVPAESAPGARSLKPALLPSSPIDLQRAYRLGHRLPAVSRAADPAIQRLIFWDRLGKTYDPETLSAGGLGFKLQGWQFERQQPLHLRRSGLSDPEIDGRISELTQQIATTTANQGVPRKARLGDDFVRKHLLAGDQIVPRTLKDSIEKSIDYNRGRNTVLHATPTERDQIQAAAMAAIRQRGFPAGEMVYFPVQIGKATAYDETAPQGQGGSGNFAIFTNARLVLGAVWDPGSQTGQLVHLEALYAWGGRDNYTYLADQHGERLIPVPNDGRARIDL